MTGSAVEGWGKKEPSFRGATLRSAAENALSKGSRAANDRVQPSRLMIRIADTIAGLLAMYRGVAPIVAGCPTYIPGLALSS
jgi:hypothetical protein